MVHQWSTLVLGDFRKATALEQRKLEGRILLVLAVYHLIVGGAIFLLCSRFYESDNFLSAVATFSPSGVILEDLLRRISDRKVVAYILLSETLVPLASMIFAAALVYAISDNVLKVDHIQKSRNARLLGYGLAIVVVLLGWELSHFWNDTHDGRYSLAGASDYTLLGAEAFKQYFFGVMLIGLAVELSKLWHERAAQARRSK